MISAGNDIVALNAIDIARTNQPNFYSKFVNVAEKAIYDQQAASNLAFGQFVWLLWSVKESAYKYFQRLIPGLVFSPLKLVVSDIDFHAKRRAAILEGTGFDDRSVYKGSVFLGGDKLYFRSIVEDDFIFSTVNDEDDFTNTSWGIQVIGSADPGHQSKEVRDFLIRRLKHLLPSADLQIGKNLHSCPILLNKEEETGIPVSLAHHDRYIAYSFQLK